MPQIAIMILGIGGAGKSTAATCLAAALRTSGYDPWLVHFDQMRKDLAPNCADPFSANPMIRQAIYDRASTVFMRHVSQGGSLIIDAGLSTEGIRKQMKREIPGLRIVHLHCPLWLALLRDTSRSFARAGHDRGRFLYFRAILSRLNPFRSKTSLFPQPAITTPFEYPACADLHVSTFWRSPIQVAQDVVDGLAVSHLNATPCRPDEAITQDNEGPELRLRLERAAKLLSIIDRKRRETGAEELGRNAELMVINRELTDLGLRASSCNGSERHGSEASRSRDVGWVG